MGQSLASPTVQEMRDAGLLDSDDYSSEDTDYSPHRTPQPPQSNEDRERLFAEIDDLFDDSEDERQRKAKASRDRAEQERNNPDDLDQDWKISETAVPPGRRKKKKKVVQLKKARDHALSKRQYAFFEKAGQLASLALVSSCYMEGTLTYTGSRTLLEAIDIEDHHGKFRVKFKTERRPTKLDEIRSVLPLKTISGAENAMRNFVNKQVNRDGASSADVVVVIGDRAYSSAALRVMRHAHSAKNNLAMLQGGLLWLKSNPHDPSPATEWLHHPKDYSRIASLMKNTSLVASSSSILQFAGREWIDSDAITSTLAVLEVDSGPRSFVFVPAGVTSIQQQPKGLIETVPAIQRLAELPKQHVAHQVRASSSQPGTQSLSATQLLSTTQSLSATQLLSTTQSLSATPSLPLLFIALHCVDPEHWCGICVDFDTHAIITFDPFQDSSRYEDMERWTTRNLVPLIPRLQQSVFRYKRFDRLQQVDSYNCGIFVLLFFESCIHGTSSMTLAASSLSALTKHARYRYLSMNLEALHL